MSVVFGADVSAYQTVNYAKAASSLGFIIVKCTEGRGGPSSAWLTHWSGVKAAGMLRGSYHLAHPSSNAPTVEAANYASVLARSGFVAGFDLPPALDIEPSHGLGRAALTVWARAFMAAVDDKLGLAKLDAWHRCGWYAGDSVPNLDRAAVGEGRWFWRGTYGREYVTDKDGVYAVPAGCSIAQWVTPASQVPGVTESRDVDRDIARPEDLRRMAPVYYNDPEEDMAITDAEIGKIAEAVYAYKGIQNRNEPAGPSTGMQSLASAITNIEATQDGDHASLNALLAKVAAVGKAVEALAAGLGPTVQAAVTAALAAGLVDVDVTVHDKTEAGS